MRGQLAEQYRTGVIELRRRRRVPRGDAINEDARVARGQDPLRVVDVLECERDPVKRAAISPGDDVRLGVSRLPAREVERARDERVRLRVVLLDPTDQRLDQVDR